MLPVFWRRRWKGLAVLSSVRECDLCLTNGADRLREVGEQEETKIDTGSDLMRLLSAMQSLNFVETEFAFSYQNIISWLEVLKCLSA